MDKLIKKMLKLKRAGVQDVKNLSPSMQLHLAELFLEKNAADLEHYQSLMMVIQKSKKELKTMKQDVEFTKLVANCMDPLYKPLNALLHSVTDNSENSNEQSDI